MVAGAFGRMGELPVEPDCYELVINCTGYESSGWKEINPDKRNTLSGNCKNGKGQHITNRFIL